MDKIWNLEQEGGRCINFNIALLTSSVVNVISDFLILLLPMLAIWRLHVAPKRKFGILLEFATGLM